jgi:hypothetical protein
LTLSKSFTHSGTVVTALTGKGVNDGLKRAMVGHDIDTRLSSMTTHIHPSALTVPICTMQSADSTMRALILRLKVPQDSFLPIIAKRIIQQAEQRKKAEKAAEKAKWPQKRRPKLSKARDKNLKIARPFCLLCNEPPSVWIAWSACKVN